MDRSYFQTDKWKQILRKTSNDNRIGLLNFARIEKRNYQLINVLITQHSYTSMLLEFFRSDQIDRVFAFMCGDGLFERTDVTPHTVC
jgi:hypothetical protein